MNQTGETAVHQFVAGFTAGDAISNTALTMRALFRQWGYTSEIFSEPARTMPAWRKTAPNAHQAEKILRPEDVVVLHLSIGSAVNDVFARLRCRKAIVYHNMTPDFYFRGFHEQLARDLAWGRRQAAALAGRADVVMAVSQFNAAELAALGYDEVVVLPLLIDFDRVMTPPDRGLLRRLGARRAGAGCAAGCGGCKRGCGSPSGRMNVIFVGRAVPNKKLEDLLQAFYVLQNTVAPEAHLIHVGSFAGLPRYQSLLVAQVKSLRLRNVTFMGGVPQRELSAVYAAGDVFLSMSEHEGFCIPILESMAHGVPVAAYAAGAVPETMAGAGVLFQRKRWEYIAETLGMIAGDPILREGIIRRQNERVAAYRRRDLAAELRACLEPLLRADGDGAGSNCKKSCAVGLRSVSP